MKAAPGTMQPSTDFGRPNNGFRRRIYDVIFGIDTPAGRGLHGSQSPIDPESTSLAASVIDI